MWPQSPKARDQGHRRLDRIRNETWTIHQQSILLQSVRSISPIAFHLERQGEANCPVDVYCIALPAETAPDSKSLWLWLCRNRRRLQTNCARHAQRVDRVSLIVSKYLMDSGASRKSHIARNGRGLPFGKCN